ncbi:unnamed protein product [Acanthoscelides obtectus]|uniref:Uncharacterized protein n=1 Tax=Acanthoscelides obtectus TaxID=200917 RepID=A0A9P0QF14_ACAOB|nr:unnamed protein product [Acanthoscelides obtectus]CAK1629803.1 hypothetical protein AOBTE_LOCUS5964 [Acanthoscelides obtectus]
MSKLMVLFIIFILGRSTSSIKFLSDKGIVDMRFTCVNNFTRTIYLPLGVRKMESIVLFISTTFVLPQCKIKFYTYPANNIGIILVIDLLEGSLVEGELFV